MFIIKEFEKYKINTYVTIKNKNLEFWRVLKHSYAEIPNAWNIEELFFEVFYKNIPLFMTFTIISEKLLA